MALIVMSLGALMVAPVMDYMATGVSAAASQRELSRELYAADAGMEYGMWRIENGASVGFSESIAVGAVTVDVTVSVLVELPYGPVLGGGTTHTEWLIVTTDTVELGDGLYSVTILIDNSGGSGNVKLETIGVGMQKRFDYVPGSSSGVTTSAPTVIFEKRVAWEFSGDDRPVLLDGDSATQTFQMEGEGVPKRVYGWVVASRLDVGTVSSCEGYNVVSQAADTRIEAAVVKNEGIVYPVSWTITRVGGP